MATFTTALTDAGRALMADVVSDTDSIVFTAVQVGDGSYQASEKTQAALRARTALKSLKETYDVSFTEQTTPLEVRLKSNIANYDPETHTALFAEGFYVNEIGVMARPASGGAAILFMIAVVTTEQGDFLPHYEGSNPVEMVQDIIIKVNNDVTITVTYSGSAFALVEDVNKWDFDIVYGLCNKTTVIDKDSQDHTRITETAEDGTEAVTIIVPTSSTVTTMTTTIETEDATYVKTIVGTKSASNTTFVESYTQS